MKFGSDHTIATAFSFAHDSGGEDILSVLLTDNDVIQEVPVFGTGVLPGGFVSGLHLED